MRMSKYFWAREVGGSNPPPCSNAEVAQVGERES